MSRLETETTDANRGERAWVLRLVQWLREALAAANAADRTVDVSAGYKLAYTNEVLRYDWNDVPDGRPNKYQTDLLISDCCVDQTWWIPRVVVECKVGSASTHAVQTYSTKAGTHKQVHPYLRYGFLMAEIGDCIPTRVIRHGMHFDFIAAVKSRELGRAEKDTLVEILLDEIQTSRRLHGLLLDRTRGRDRCRVLRRGLSLK